MPASNILRNDCVATFT
ncbi:hypothetical protein FG05_35427 [Fusarium graminearum]|nr:hypothetical protein FG05_35427 [Fusarium graminearum]